MAYKILVSEVVSETGLDYLRSRGYEIIYGTGTDAGIFSDELSLCDAVIVRTAPCHKNVLEKCPNLKVIGKHGVGVDNIDLDYCRAHGIRVTNTPAANVTSVAEHTMALIMACAKQIPYKAAEYKSGNYFIKDQCLSTEISGKTLSLIGFGRIGSLVASMAVNGFGMRVIAYDPYLPADKKISGVTLIREWDKVFEEGDFISLHLPSTPETYKLVGSNEFRMMKRSAVIINTARGTILDENALFQALKNEEITGAGLDVSDPEPAETNNKLFSLPNVIMTPHCGGVTQDAMVRMALGAAQGIDAVLSDRRPQWPVV
ncbi:MAG: hydroxyacid dehydrogenase [Oscillospiraceae bacterium]